METRTLKLIHDTGHENRARGLVWSTCEATRDHVENITIFAAIYPSQLANHPHISIGSFLGNKGTFLDKARGISR